MAYNASERKDIRRKEKAEALAATQRREVITSIMTTIAGRSWLWDRLADTHIFSTTNVPGDALGSAFQEGQRSMGLSLLADIMAHCPDLFIQAMREHNERHLSDDTASRTDSTAERPSGAIADGGDSGAESDQASDAGTDARAEAERGWNPGADIYVDQREEPRRYT